MVSITNTHTPFHQPVWTGCVVIFICTRPATSVSVSRLCPPDPQHETVEGYRRYFNQIVGFFVVEDHILHATQGLVTRAFTDELWNMALSKIIAVLRTHSVRGHTHTHSLSLHTHLAGGREGGEILSERPVPCIAQWGHAELCQGLCD